MKKKTAVGVAQTVVKGAAQILEQRNTIKREKKKKKKYLVSKGERERQQLHRRSGAAPETKREGKQRPSV